MRFATTCDKPFFGGTLPAGSVVFVTTAMVYIDGRGMGPVFIDGYLKYLDDATPSSEQAKRIEENKVAPWVGPDAKVKVPEFVPAAKVEESKPSHSTATSSPRPRVKPGQGQKSMFDSIDEI